MAPREAPEIPIGEEGKETPLIQRDCIVKPRTEEPRLIRGIIKGLLIFWAIVGIALYMWSQS